MNYKETLVKIVNLICDTANANTSDEMLSALSEDAFNILDEMDDQKLAVEIARENAVAELGAVQPAIDLLAKKATKYVEMVEKPEEQEKSETPAEESETSTKPRGETSGH